MTLKIISYSAGYSCTIADDLSFCFERLWSLSRKCGKMSSMSDDKLTDDDSLEESVQGHETVSVTIPKFTKWSVRQIYDYEKELVDYHSLEQLEKSIQAARKAVFLINDKINEYERKEKEAKIAYDRSYRREYLSSVEKTETAKRARAELKCEELENEWLTMEQLKNELVRMSFSMKTELQTLQTISNNLRQQLKML